MSFVLNLFDLSNIGRGGGSGLGISFLAGSFCNPRLSRPDNDALIGSCARRHRSFENEVLILAEKTCILEGNRTPKLNVPTRDYELKMKKKSERMNKKNSI